MKKITGKRAMIALSVLATMLVILGATHAKEMKMQESSYAPVMITKSFEAVRERERPVRLEDDLLVDDGDDTTFRVLRVRALVVGEHQREV